MKKLILACLIVLLAAPSAFAVGTVTIVETTGYGGDLRVLVITWVGHATGGSVPDTVINLGPSLIMKIVTDPGSPAPTAAYDIVLEDSNGLDVFGGQLTDLSATVTAQYVPRLNVAPPLYGTAYVNGALTFKLSGNSVNSATGTVTIVMSRLDD